MTSLTFSEWEPPSRAEHAPDRPKPAKAPKTTKKAAAAGGAAAARPNLSQFNRDEDGEDYHPAFYEAEGEAEGKPKAKAKGVKTAKAEEWQGLPAGHETPEVSAIVEQMNAQHAAIFTGSDFQILTERDERDPVTGRMVRTYKLAPDMALKKWYATDLIKITTTNTRGDSKTDYVSKFDLWLRDPRRRKYTGLVFDPRPDADPTKYNLFRGFPVKPDDRPNPEKRCPYILDLVRNVLCKGEEYKATALLDWSAHLVQRPWEKPTWAIGVQGKRGIGKTTYFQKVLGGLLGPHFKTVSHPDQILGRWAGSVLQDALLIYLGEMVWAGDKQAEQVLKKLISDGDFLGERKYQDAEKMQNFARFAADSNEDWIFPAGSDERRFLAMEASAARKGDLKYWDALNKEIENGGLEAFMAFLLNRKIESHMHGPPPATQELQTQKMLSASPLERWWFESVDGENIGQEGWPRNITVPRIYDAFLAWLRAHDIRFKPDRAVFGRQIKKVCTSITDGPKFGTGANRANSYDLPSPEQARADLEAYFGGPLSWTSGTPEAWEPEEGSHASYEEQIPY